jgi:hypothetical protein
MRKNDLVIFESKIQITPGCWYWLGARHPRGYGRFRGPCGDTAHRYSYYSYVGAIPEGAQICHRCDNPSCVNPDHLFVGSNQDNVDDKVAKGRHPKGQKSATSKLSEVEVIEVRRLYVKGSTDYGTRALARKFGISHRQIWGIVTHKGWTHLAQ